MLFLIQLLANNIFCYKELDKKLNESQELKDLEKELETKQAKFTATFSEMKASAKVDLAAFQNDPSNPNHFDNVFKKYNDNSGNYEKERKQIKKTLDDKIDEFFGLIKSGGFRNEEEKEKGFKLEEEINKEFFFGNMAAEGHENNLFVKLKDSLSKNQFISKKTNLLMKETYKQRWEVCRVYQKIRNKTNSITREWFNNQISRIADKGHKRQILYLCLQLIPAVCMLIGGIISFCISFYKSKKKGKNNQRKNENGTIEELPNDELTQTTELMLPDKNENIDQNEEYHLNNTLNSKISTVQAQDK